MDFKDLIINTIIDAGSEVLKYFNSNYELKFKEDASPLTSADIAANEIIIRNLSKTNFPIISEESISEIKNTNSKSFWLIDPIDGTKQFIKSDPQFTLNIALITKNKVDKAAVYAPALNLLYYADIEDGAYKINTENHDFKRLRVNSISHHIKILCSKSHLNEETLITIDRIRKEFATSEVERVGSSLKFCLIADGYADLYVRKGKINTWDIAAGHTVLKAAGGNVLDFFNFAEITYSYKNHLLGSFLAIGESEFVKNNDKIFR
jgi:3'(2'), 5'-bisphosphate nucleotidase